jgi:hypothetical protein
VLDVQGEPSGEVAAREGHAVLHEGERDERRDDGDEHGGGSGHRVVDDDAGQQRPEGAEADPEHGRHQRGDRDTGMAQAGAPETADPPPAL